MIVQKGASQIDCTKSTETRCWKRKGEAIFVTDNKEVPDLAPGDGDDADDDETEDKRDSEEGQMSI